MENTFLVALESKGIEILVMLLNLFVQLFTKTNSMNLQTESLFLMSMKTVMWIYYLLDMLESAFSLILNLTVNIDFPGCFLNVLPVLT